MQSFHHYQLRHRKDQRIDNNNLTDTINYRHSSLDVALTITKPNYWLLKTTTETYRSNASSSCLELLSIGFGSLLFLETNVSIVSLYGHSLDLDGIYWTEASLAKGDVTRSQFELVQPPLSSPSRTAYSLVLLIGSGIGPIGALSGLKGFILLNSSGLRQRVKNRYSRNMSFDYYYCPRCSKKYRSTECEDRLDWWILFFRTLNDIIDRCASHRAIPDYPLSKVLNELSLFHSSLYHSQQ